MITIALLIQQQHYLIMDIANNANNNRSISVNICS